MAFWHVHSPFGDYAPGDVIEGPDNFSRNCPFVDPEPVQAPDPNAKPKNAKSDEGDKGKPDDGE